jgi:hypothetical protein
VFEGARAIATGFGMEPHRLLEWVVAVAAGNTATIALRADGSLLQWAGGAGPRRLRELRRASVAATAGQNAK